MSVSSLQHELCHIWVNMKIQQELINHIVSFESVEEELNSAVSKWVS